MVCVDSLPMLLDSQREAFLSAFDEREDAMNGLLGGAGTVVRDAGPLMASGERIVEMSPEVMASVNRTLEVMQELVAALRDPDAPGGGVFSLGGVVRTGRHHDCETRTPLACPQDRAVLGHSTRRLHHGTAAIPDQ